MKTKHTPAPWAILDRPETSLPESRTLTHISNGAHIVCTLGSTRSDGSQNHSANARLIAAAPDLLDALNQAYNALAWPCDDQEETEELLETLRAALRKANPAWGKEAA